MTPDEHSTAGGGSRAAIAAWCLFDCANSSIPTIVVTFLFSTYFTEAVAPNPELGTALWGQVNSLVAVVAAFTAPLLGAIADQGGRRKPWLLALSLACIAATASLWFVQPHPDGMAFALTAYAISSLTFELALVFYNAMMPELAPKQKLGRISGWGWGAGYLGGLACLLVNLLLFVRPDPPLFGLDRAMAEQIRITSPFAAAWFLLFALPLFALVPDRTATGLRWSTAIHRGLSSLIETFRQLGAHRNILLFLLAKMIYTDGLNTLFAFGGIYAAGTFGMGFDEILWFAIAANVSSGLGAVAFAWVDDWIGAKPTILIALAGLIVLGAAILFVDSKKAFVVLAVSLGLFLGPAQASSRSLMSRLAPSDRRAEFFGLFALAGRVTAFLGPALVGWVTFAVQSQRAGIATILPFLVIGGILLLFVKEPRTAENKETIAT
jgi:UMF1 family MFS transporter